MDPDEGAGRADGIAAELYALGLDEFTSQRDARARQLRRDGERAAADAVKALRKPSVAAWALNQLRRTHADRLQALLDAGSALRDAQQRLLSAGDRDGVRVASARERELVAELASAAANSLAAAGRANGPTVRERLAATLHAAAGDERVRTLLTAGRLVADHEIADLGLAGPEVAGLNVAGVGVPSPDPTAPDPTAAEPRAAEITAADPTPGPPAHALDAARRRLVDAEADAARLARQTATAEEALREAERVLDGARDREASARARVAEQRRRLERLTGGR